MERALGLQNERGSEHVVLSLRVAQDFHPDFPGKGSTLINWLFRGGGGGGGRGRWGQHINRPRADGYFDEGAGGTPLSCFCSDVGWFFGFNRMNE